MEFEDLSENIYLYKELKDSYENKYKFKNIYPREWYDIDDIDDIDLKIKLLKDALDQDVSLFDLDYIINLARENAQRRYEKNVEEMVDRMINSHNNL